MKKYKKIKKAESLTKKYKINDFPELQASLEVPNSWLTDLGPQGMSIAPKNHWFYTFWWVFKLFYTCFILFYILLYFLYFAAEVFTFWLLGASWCFPWPLKIRPQGFWRRLGSFKTICRPRGDLEASRRLGSIEATWRPRGDLQASRRLASLEATYRHRGDLQASRNDLERI